MVSRILGIVVFALVAAAGAVYAMKADGPMKGEMKKDGMKRGDVKKAAEQKQREMKEMMEREGKGKSR